MISSKEFIKADTVVYAWTSSTQEAEEGISCCEFELSLAYVLISRPAWAVYQNPVSKHKLISRQRTLKQKRSAVCLCPSKARLLRSQIQPRLQGSRL